MDILMKLGGSVMLLVGISIILEELGIFSLNVGINKLIIGALLMICLQVLNIFLLKSHNGSIGVMNVVMLLIFLVPVFGYFFSGMLDIGFKDQLPLIIGIMISVESLYMLH